MVLLWYFYYGGIIIINYYYYYRFAGSPRRPTNSVRSSGAGETLGPLEEQEALFIYRAISCKCDLLGWVIVSEADCLQLLT